MLSKKRIAITCRKTLRVVEPTNILYCKSQDYCTLIYLDDGTCFSCSKSLAKLAKEINDPNFLRVSQSFLVNFSHIDYFDKLEKVVKLKNGDAIPYTLKIRELLELIDATGHNEEGTLTEVQNPEQEGR